MNLSKEDYLPTCPNHMPPLILQAEEPKSELWPAKIKTRLDESKWEWVFQNLIMNKNRANQYMGI